jgi:hypothetical protein
VSLFAKGDRDFEKKAQRGTSAAGRLLAFHTTTLDRRS